MTSSRGVFGWSFAVIAILSVLASFSSSASQQPSTRALFPAGPGATNPDPPCFDNANRYVDCGNGTVTDTSTGLIWLQDAGCLGQLNWAEANQAAARLTHGRCALTDRSNPGDWRLPTNGEWTTMVAAAVNHPSLHCTNPALTNDSGSMCFGLGAGSSFSNVASDGYWSSTTNSQSSGLLPDGTKAGTMNLLNGFLASLFDKACCPQWVWPVRAH